MSVRSVAASLHWKISIFPGGGPPFCPSSAVPRVGCPLFGLRNRALLTWIIERAYCPTEDALRGAPARSDMFRLVFPFARHQISPEIPVGTDVRHEGRHHHSRCDPH